MKGLTLQELAVLINADPEHTQEMFKTAGHIKKEIYGERLVLFAPLYISNYCVNDCEYCGFHVRNKMCRKNLHLKKLNSH